MTPKLNEQPGRRTSEAQKLWIAVDSACTGLGLPKSAQLCPPGPAMRTRNRRLPKAWLVIRWSPDPSTAIKLALDAIPQWTVEKMANPAQVPFPLFADVSHNDYRPSKLDAVFFRCAQRPQQRHNAGAIV